MIRWLRCRLGRRGTAALASALMLFGIGWVVAYEPSEWVRDEALPHMLIPLSIRVGLWWGTALIAAVLSFSRRWQWLAWPVIVIMPAERALSNAWSALMYLLPGGLGGSVRSLGEVIVYGAAATLALCLAGWLEDDPNKIKADCE